MNAKAYFFAVWAPEGDDCPAAVAGVVANSLSTARTAMRTSGMRMVGKEPLTVDRELREVGDWPRGRVYWRYADGGAWRSL